MSDPARLDPKSKPAGPRPFVPTDPEALALHEAALHVREGRLGEAVRVVNMVIAKLKKRLGASPKP